MAHKLGNKSADKGEAEKHYNTVTCSACGVEDYPDSSQPPPYTCVECGAPAQITGRMDYKPLGD